MRLKISFVVQFIALLFLAVTPAWAAQNVKVILMAGQSNMQGYATASNLPPTLLSPQTDVLFYDGSGDSKIRNTLMALQPNTTTSGAYFGPEVTFGRAMADGDPDTTYALIKYGDSGKNLHTDFRAPHAGQPVGGSKYQAMMSTFSGGLLALAAAGYTPEISGMLWLQGESDAGTLVHASAYEANLTDFIANMRVNFGADLPFVIGGIGYTSSEFRDIVMDSQQNLAETLDNVAYFSNDDINSTPPNYHFLHFETGQMETIGQRYASALQAIPEPDAGCFFLLVALAFSNARRRRK